MLSVCTVYLVAYDPLSMTKLGQQSDFEVTKNSYFYIMDKQMIFPHTTGHLLGI